MIKILFFFSFLFGGLPCLAERDDDAAMYRLNMSPHAVAMRKHAREAMKKAGQDHILRRKAQIRQQQLEREAATPPAPRQRLTNNNQR